MHAIIFDQIGISGTQNVVPILSLLVSILTIVYVMTRNKNLDNQKAIEDLDNKKADQKEVEGVKRMIEEEKLSNNREHERIWIEMSKKYESIDGKLDILLRDRLNKRS